MEPISINFHYYNEDVTLSIENKLYETIQTVFSTAIIKNKGHSYEIPLKWNFRRMSTKTTSEIQCDILAVFHLAMDVGRPEQKYKAGFLESGVKAGYLMKSGALLFLNVMSSGVNLEEYNMRTAQGYSNFFTEKEYPENLKEFPFKSCSIDVNFDLEVVKKRIKSDIAQGKKTSAYQNNMPEIKLMIDNVIQEKFNNMPQKEKEKYIKPPIQEGTKSSPQPAMQPKANSEPDDKVKAFAKRKDDNSEIAKHLPNETASERYKRLGSLFNKSQEILVPNIVPIQVQPVPLLLQEGAKSSPQSAMQSKVNPEPNEKVKAFGKWKDDNPEIAKHLPNETDGERYKRLWPLFNKSREILVPNIVPIQVQPVPQTDPEPEPVPLLLQEDTKSSPQPATQPKVNPEPNEKVQAFVKWKSDNPEIAKHLPNETDGERYKRLWPLFNKSREILVPNIAPI